MIRRVFVLSFLLAACAPPAHAAWPEDGVVLESGYDAPTYILTSIDGAGVVAWMDAQHGAVRPITAHRMGLDGALHAGWDATATVYGIGVPDGQGGLFKLDRWLGASDWELRGWHVPVSGGSDWSTDGAILLGPSRFVSQKMAGAPDGSGGLYIAGFIGSPRRLNVHRALPFGVPAPGWPIGGTEIHDPSWVGVREEVVAVGDGAGGALVAWGSALASDLSLLMVQRLLPGGVEEPNWGGIGVPACDPVNHALLPLAILPSGPDHLFVCWRVVAPNESQIRIQRMTIKDGSIAPGWPPDGVLIVQGFPAALGRSLVAVPDGLEGAVVAWRSDDGTARGRRLLPGGVDAAGWPATGLNLLDPAAMLSWPAGGLALASAKGTILVLWGDSRVSGRVWTRARWLLADGTPDPAQPEAARVITPNVAHAAYLVGASSDGTGGAYFGWVDLHWPTDGVPDDYKVSWVPYQNQNLVSVPDLPSSQTLNFRGVWPNPARREINFRVVLADESPARVELVDVAGHCLRSLDVRGAGEHLERFERLDALSAGVYFVRLTHRGRTSTSRVALVH